MSDDSPEDRTPGQLLRAQREQQGLSRAEIAARLYLNEQLVTALEADDYACFVSVTYAIGHLRSYARLLALDDNDLVDLFYQENPGLRPHLEPMIIHRSRQLAGSDRPILFLNWLIGLTILLLAILWYRDNYVAQDSIPPEPVLADTGQSAPPGAGTSEPRREEAAPDQRLDAEAQDAAADRFLQTPPADDPPGDAPGDAPGDISGDAPGDSPGGPPGDIPEQAAPAEGAAVADSAAADRDAGENAVADTDNDNTGAEGAAAGPALSGTGLSLLEVALVGGDSWVEIYDVRGQTLFLQLARDGLEQTLSGQGPFRIVIGNTPPVRLTYQGRQVDIEAHIGPTGTARFILE